MQPRGCISLLKFFYLLGHFNTATMTVEVGQLIFCHSFLGGTPTIQVTESVSLLSGEASEVI